jgi:hypothetical protein
MQIKVMRSTASGTALVWQGSGLEARSAAGQAEKEALKKTLCAEPPPLALASQWLRVLNADGVLNEK